MRARTYPLLALTLAAGLALASCSSSSTTADGQPSTSSEAPAPAASTPAAEAEDAAKELTLEGLAAQTGVTDFEISTSPAPAALSWGQGTLDGSTVKLYEFVDDAAFQGFLDTVAGFGVTAENIIRVGNFAIAPDDQAQLEQIRAAVGA